MKETTREEITLFELLEILWDARKFFFRVAVISGCFGLVIGFSSPKEWRAEARVLLNHSDQMDLSGSLGDLAGLAGLNLPNSTSSTINPYAFEDILKGDPFIKSLLSTPFKYRSDTILFQDYCEKHLKKTWFQKLRSLPGYIASLFNQSNRVIEGYSDFIAVTAKEEQLIDRLEKRISYEYDAEKGILTFSMDIQDPLLSAQIGHFMMNYLSEYVDQFVNRQNETRLVFISNQLNEKEESFKLAQYALAKFRDENTMLNSNLVKNQLERLKTDYNLSFSLYAEMAQNYEQIKISLEEDQMVIQPLGPITIPVEEVAPNKPIILLSCVFTALTVSIFYLLVKMRVTDNR